MASSAPPSAAGPIQNPTGGKKSLGFLAIAKQRKHSFIQFFAMTGIFLLSCRSLGQKYRIHGLNEDNAALKEDQQALDSRMSQIKRSLLAEADLEPTGAFAARLRLMFGDASD